MFCQACNYLLHVINFMESSDLQCENLHKKMRAAVKGSKESNVNINALCVSEICNIIQLGRYFFHRCMNNNNIWEQ